VAVRLIRPRTGQGIVAQDNQITQLLSEWGGGNASALDRLAPLVYGELRRMAARHLRRERAGHTLQTTGLVHEAFLRLVDQRSARWQNRAHFFSIASRTMRRVLVDQARARHAVKRGEGRTRVDIDDLEAVLDGQGDLALVSVELTPAGQERHADLIMIDDALTRLEALDERQARIVEMRFFGGLTIEETSQSLNISPATVKRDWLMAKAWLARELAGAAPA
jgi:RNA polymerase sigma factor (TIGR02999 family)